MILATLPVILIFLILVALFTLRYFERELIAIISQEQFSMLTARAQDIDDKITNAQDSLTGITRFVNSDMLAAPEQAGAFLKTATGMLSLFDNGIVLIRESGSVIAEFPFGLHPPGKNFSGREFMQKTRATGKPYISDPFISSRKHHHPIIVMTAPIFNAQGKLVAVLAGSINLMKNHVLGSLIDVRIGSTGYLYLFNKKRTLILHPDKKKILQPACPPGVNALFDQAINGFEGSGITDQAQGEKSLNTFKALKSKDWILAAQYPVHEAYLPITKARHYFYVVFLLAAALIFFTTSAAVRYFIAPLAALISHVKAIAAAPAAHQPIQASTTDEIGELAVCFNDFMQQLKKKETQLLEQKIFSENLLGQSAVPAFVISAAHEVILWNRACEKLTGVSASEMLGTTNYWKCFYTEKRICLADAIVDQMPEESFAFAYDKLFRSAMIPDGFHSEGYFKKLNGKKCCLSFEAAPIRDHTGTVIAAIETFQDITEHKQIEQAIREQFQFLQLLIDTIPQPIFYKNAEKRFLGCNKAFAEFFNVHQEHIVGKTLHDIFPTEIADHCQRHEQTVFEYSGIQTIEDVISHGGRTSTAIVTLAPYRKTDGTLAGLIGIILDITDRKKLEEQLHEVQETEKKILRQKKRELEAAYHELKTAQTQIFQQEKMASIGQLAAGVAHEINNPVGFIMSNLGSLQKYLARLTEFISLQTDTLQSLSSISETPSQVLQEIEEKKQTLKIDYILHDTRALITESLDGAEKVKKIVQDFKNFSHIGNTEQKLTDINECLESTINIVWNELKYKATLEKAFGDLPKTCCNPGQLSQVFVNILMNAVQAIEKQGIIWISTWWRNTDISIVIQDTGCGIPQNTIRKIFDPFFTTKEVGKGTGLGLSIVYEIIKKHAGTISVESDVGKGTTFTITIPIREEPGHDNRATSDIMC